MKLQISASGLEKKIASRIVFSPLHFEVNREECCLLTGKNGSGKSLLLMILAGLLKPSAGQVKLHSPFSFCPASEGFDPFLSVKANLSWAKGDPSFVMDKLGLNDLASTPMEKLSLGQKKRVTLARSFFLDRPILLLDEPLVGLDSEFKSKFFDLLKLQISRKHSLVIATHNPDEFAFLSPQNIHLES